MKNFQVCTLGSITLDTFVEPSEVKLHKAKNGRMQMNFEVGQKIQIKTIARHIGGGSANSAVGFSRLGLKTTALGTIGYDDHGDFILHRLERMRVNTDSIKIKKRIPSSSSLIFNLPDGHRTVFEEHTVHSPFKKLPKTKSVYLSHVHQGEIDIFDRLIEWKQKAEKKLFTKTKFIGWNPGKTQFDAGFSAFEDFFPFVDLLILNREEAEMFSGFKTRLLQPKRLAIKQLWETTPGFRKNDGTIASMKKVAEKFLTAGVKAIVITDGLRGAQYFSQKEALWAPIISDREPVSTLGAGDAFSVGCMGAALWGKSTKKQMQWGTENSESVIRVFGAQEGQLKKKDLK